MTGTYQWVAVYSGDGNNAGAVDQGSSTAAFNADLPATATEVFTAQGQGGSYWTVSLSNAGDLNGTYQDWCIDTSHTSTTGQSYTVNVYPTTGATIPAGLVPTPGNFPEVNWVLNQNFVGTTDTTSGGTYTYGDVQEAIWSLLGVPGSSSGVGHHHPEPRQRHRQPGQQPRQLRARLRPGSRRHPAAGHEQPGHHRRRPDRRRRAGRRHPGQPRHQHDARRPGQPR